MAIQWVPYKSFLEDISSDLEVLMLYSSPSEGVSLKDIYQYVCCLNLIYCKLCTEKTGENLDELVSESYRQNDEFLGITLRKAFKDKHHISLHEVVKLLENFKIPQSN